MNDLIVNSSGLALYHKMAAAIAACDSVDECKDIIDKSVALATYYEQVRDTETVLRFNRVRLRAFRRMTELFATVDMTGATNRKTQVKRIRASFTEAAIAHMGDYTIEQLLRLMTVPEVEFESAINQPDLTGSINDLVNRTPQRQVELKEAEERKLRMAAADEQIYRERHQPNGDLTDIEQQVEWNDLRTASARAFQEVGLTLDRRFRAEMMQVVFIIKNDVHAVMRQAAFDQKITMAEVLRRGLKMWLTAHHYEFPEKPPRAPKGRPPKKKIEGVSP